MLRRPLGDSGLEVSVIGLGTAPMGGDVTVWGRVDDRESIAAIHQALECGMNLIETAPWYGDGHSEAIVGKAIYGHREGVVVATQCGGPGKPFVGSARGRGLHRANVLRACDESLRRLRTDAIDLYQCGAPDPDTPIAETMQALCDLRSRGKIRAIGLCNFSLEQTAAAREFGPVHAVQAPFSALNVRAAVDLIPYCQERGIAVLASSPLSKGLLTGKFTAETRFEDLRRRDPDFAGQRLRRNLEIVSELAALAARHEKTPAQFALNWVIHRPGITAAIAGAKRPSQVLENCGASGWTLRDAERMSIDEMAKG